MNGEVDRDMTHHFQRDPPLSLHWNSMEGGAEFNLENAFEGLSVVRKKVRFDDETIGDMGEEMSKDKSTEESTEEMKDIVEHEIEDEMQGKGEEEGAKRNAKKRSFMSVPARFGNIAPLSLYDHMLNRNVFKPVSKKRKTVFARLPQVVELNDEK